ncbi:ricin-type beta-trefoil lectin domain protein [Streptomyces sp. NPDC055709]
MLAIRSPIRAKRTATACLLTAMTVTASLFAAPPASAADTTALEACKDDNSKNYYRVYECTLTVTAEYQWTDGGQKASSIVNMCPPLASGSVDVLRTHATQVGYSSTQSMGINIGVGMADVVVGGTFSYSKTQDNATVSTRSERQSLNLSSGTAGAWYFQPDWFVQEGTLKVTRQSPPPTNFNIADSSIRRYVPRKDGEGLLLGIWKPLVHKCTPPGLTITFTNPSYTTYPPTWYTECMDVSQSNAYKGALVQGWQCNNTTAQGWTYPDPGEDGTVESWLAPGPGGKKWCLDVAGSGTALYTKVQLWECNGTGAQRFVRDPNNGQLKNPNSGLCVSEDRDQTRGGLLLYHCDRTDVVAQRWQNKPREIDYNKFPTNLNLR